MAVAMSSYLKTAEAIYDLSFQRVAAAVPGLAQCPPDIRRMLARSIHAVADPSIFEDFRYSADVAEATRVALRAGADILCDSRMLAAGIRRQCLSIGGGNDCVVMLDHPEVDTTAGRFATTRSAAGVIAHRECLGGGIVVIGNAPTALFALLEGLVAGWSPPAVIFAFPVGFVGASEAKSALLKTRLSIPYITLMGRRGGSGMAAAAINAVILDMHATSMGRV